MSFGDILEAWEQSRHAAEGGPRRAADAPPAVDMEAALERYPPPSGEPLRDRGAPGAESKPGPGRRRGAPEAELDLHGLSGAQAVQALERFLRQAHAGGLREVLIIHGKGHHSTGEPVLPRTVRSYLERCPFTGAFAAADRRQGGRGATWVRLRGGSSARGR